MSETAFTQGLRELQGIDTSSGVAHVVTGSTPYQPQADEQLRLQCFHAVCEAHQNDMCGQPIDGIIKEASDLFQFVKTGEVPDETKDAE